MNANAKNLLDIQRKINEVTAQVETMKELQDTLIDQVTELNLLIAKEGKSVYEQLLFRFDNDVAVAIADDVVEELKLKDLVASKKEDVQ